LAEQQVTRVEADWSTYTVWRGNLKEADNLEDLDVDVRLILKWVLQKWEGKGRRILDKCGSR